MRKLFFIIAVALVSLVLSGCTSSAPADIPPRESMTSTPNLTPTPTSPNSPYNLNATATSATSIDIRWVDDSNNEDGFRIYRDDSLIADVGPNTEDYQDGNLEPTTTYEYAVEAYNQVGESGLSQCTAITLNPPITVKLNKIGVHDNREPFLRGNGDVYVLVAISDGDSSIALKFPTGEGQTYSLDKDETVNINSTIFSTAEVGDYITLAIIGYESDGGSFEQIAYEALAMAVEYQTGMGSILEEFDVSLGEIIGQILGEEDDWLGSYEETWGKNDDWGVGTYKDIVCEDERGVSCLRLWFTVE